MTPTFEARVLYRPEPSTLRFLPEGPYPLGSGRISWVAIQHGANTQHGSINILDLASSENQSFELPGRPGFAFPCQDDKRFIIGCEKHLGFFNAESGEWKPLNVEIDQDKQGTIINDGLAWDNNLIFGTKDLQFATKKAGLYLFRGDDQKLIRFRDDQICSNGKAIRQLDEKLQLVDIDSPTRQVVGYELNIDAGTLSEPTVLVDLTEDSAVPDGATLTPDHQSIIISMYNPNPAEHGETRQYSLTDGSLEVIWRTPKSPQNTCPALVEIEGKVAIVITTAIENMPAECLAESINAGCLFIAETEFKTAGEYPRFQA